MDRTRIEEIQRMVCEAGKQLYCSGLVAGTWGNIGMRVDDTYMVVTPSGMNYELLNPEDMVLVNMHDRSYEGRLKPTIEVPMHAALLKARKEISACIHTHSTHALSMATARKPIPPICDDQVQILGGSVRVARYSLPATDAMADYVLEAMKDRAGCLVANHGAVTVGRTLDEAMTAAVVLEKAAQVYLETQLIGGPVELDQADIDAMHDYFLNKYGQR
jgi:L-fuculose-phosphate aldolase